MIVICFFFFSEEMDTETFNDIYPTGRDRNIGFVSPKHTWVTIKQVFCKKQMPTKQYFYENVSDLISKFNLNNI